MGADARAERIVACARDWIGTPYAHRASLRGAGADCLGLIRGLWRALVGAEPAVVPAYGAHWAETGTEGALAAGLAQVLTAVPVAEARPGDVALIRLIPGGPAKHLGVLADHPRMGPTLIHAYAGRGVVETPFGATPRRRIVAAFRFPEGER